MPGGVTNGPQPKRGAVQVEQHIVTVCQTPEERFDQGLLAVPEDVVGDMAPYLQEGMTVSLSVHEGVAIALQLPQRVTLEVVETEPVTKGQTVSSSYKPAILSNGVRSAVPPHIGVGTRIVVMTADGSYVERAKD